MATRKSKKPATTKVPHKHHLTLMQQRFVDNYVSMEKPSQSKAMKKAGSSQKGTSLSRFAIRTFQLPQVQKYFKSLQKKITDKAEKTASEIISELEQIAFSNIGDYLSFGDDGITLKNSDTLTKEQLSAVAKARETITENGGSTSFDLHNKTTALELLGKRFGIFPNRQDLNVSGEIILKPPQVT